MAVYTDSSKIAHTYLGIPFAAPPINNLRFAPPQKHMGWNGTYQANLFGPRCPQLPLKPGHHDNEDCLFLNIWAPSNAYGPVPVVVFFEGIDFYRSSSLAIAGQDLAIEGLVVVTVNYRLNVFGFFCLGTSEARGNLGLLDQYFALLWIKENIKEFGGDPEKITLFGHLSGAVSVTLHMISPRINGLFQRAIISSGSAVAPWTVKNDPIVASREILRLLGCNSYAGQLLQCMRAQRVEHILQVLQEYSDSNNWTDKFQPVVDTFLPENNRYLPQEAVKVLKEGNYLQMPILTGVSKPIANPQFPEWIDLASKGFSQLQQYVEKAKIPEIVRLYKFSDLSKVQMFNLIKWKYTSMTGGDVRVLFEQMKKLEFDSKINAPHHFQLGYLAASHVLPTFAYYLDDVGFVVNTTDNLASTELLLLFGPELLKQTGRRRFNSNEMNLSNQLKQLWINFIIFGNPTPNNNRVKPWKKYTAEDPYIENFDINSHNSKEAQYKRKETLLFWNELLPQLSNIRNGISNNIPRELQNSPDPAAGFRHAMYTLVGLVIALLALLLICIVLLKKRSKERDRHLHMGY